MENSTPQGKGMAIGGFVLALVGLLLANVIAGLCIVNGSLVLSYIWIVLCAASIIMSAMAMKKLGASGGKKGLAVAGLIIGIVGTVWAIMCMMAASTALSFVSGGGLDDLKNALEGLK